MTIRRRLLLLLLPALAVLMIGEALVDRWVAVSTTQDAYDQALTSSALAVAAYATADNTPARVDQLVRIPGRVGVSGSGELRFFALASSDGRLLAGTPGLPQLSTPARASTPVFEDMDFRGRHVRVARLWVPSARGPVVITAVETRARRDQTQRVLLFGKLLVDFAELDLLLLLIWVAVSLGLRPLARLRDEAEAQSRFELRRFDERGVPGELRGLVVAFNRVLELLHDAASAQRRFVADAAHQMRTPVTGLLAQIELLRTEAHTQPVAPQLALLERAAQSVAHSANQLLVLARAEQASAPTDTLRPVALEPLIRGLLERNLERADRAGLDLGADTRAVSIAGDPWLLEDLLGNLIDNALKYTPRGGRVTVRSGMDGDLPYLEVEDDGPGIPEAERRHVRERFYRPAGTPGIGAGLGLAIVDEIARAHEGIFTIGSGAQGRGARMRVRFARAVSLDITDESVTRLAI